MTLNTALHLWAASVKWAQLCSCTYLTGIMGKSSEIKGTKVFPKIKSALQMQSVVVLVIIITMSKTSFARAEEGAWDPEEQRIYNDFTRRIRIKPIRALVQRGSCSLALGQTRSRDTEPTRPSPQPLGVQLSGRPSQGSCISPDRWLPANSHAPEQLPIKYRNYINNINIFSYILAI